MKCMILAGGKGTRIREMTNAAPKPMVELGDRPLLWHIMKTYAHHGHSDFIVCLGYLGHVIQEYFLNYEIMNSSVTVDLGDRHSIEVHNKPKERGFKVTLAQTGLDSMTGGRIKRAAQFIGNDQTFMATYGDGLADVDIGALLEFHRSHGKIATITTVQPASRYGIVDIDPKTDRISRFVEKPQRGEWINAGYFVFEREFIDYIAGDDTVLEKNPFERLAADNQLMAYRHNGFFYAMDTFREFQELNEMWDAGNAPWKVWS